MWSQANVAEHGRISGGFADGGGAVVGEGEAALRSFSSARSSRGIIPCGCDAHAVNIAASATVWVHIVGASD